jgi:hypothetical protein
MKALSLALLLMTSMAFVLLGCSDNSDALISPNDAVVSSATTPPSLAKGGAVVGSATGGGAFITPGGDVTMFSSVKFAFTALKHKGDASGQVEMNLVGMDPSLGSKIHATVKDIKFYGNVAMFWAELKTEFLVPFFPEYPNATWKLIIVVTDNGEGRHSAPDRMSNPMLYSDDIFGPADFATAWAMSAEDFLASIPGSIGTPSDYPLARGNIQVCVK